MTDPRYHLSQLFELAFGVKSPVFVPYALDLDKLLTKDGINFSANSDQQSAQSISFQDVKLKAQEEADAFSWMGTPIVNATYFKGGNTISIKPPKNWQTAKMPESQIFIRKWQWKTLCCLLLL